MSYYKCPRAILTKPSGKAIPKGYEGEVNFAVGYRYNGGIVVKDEWYEGFEVPAPKVPKGYKLVGIGVGLQLNARPPYATQYLKKVVKKD